MAYGARLESVLGASPRGFESPILRQLTLYTNPGLWPGFVCQQLAFPSALSTSQPARLLSIGYLQSGQSCAAWFSIGKSPVCRDP